MSPLIILYLISWSMLMITVLCKQSQVLYRWIKIITAILFVMIGTMNENRMILAPLILFFVGDVFLAFANGGKVKRWLIGGLIFFWMGHIGLIFCMITQRFHYLTLVFSLIPVVMMLLIRKVFSKIDFRGLFLILTTYAYTLGILGSLAILNFTLLPILAWGIMIFILSDICLIFWYFYPQCPRIVKLINVITYFGSVLLIALS
ncbi:MAG: lysoplasmalogenase family protein [Erysipelotrichaceae bacterium]|nr:lysoplasmalogenase family protein [Erysipelotrichaceae bacterium]